MSGPLHGAAGLTGGQAGKRGSGWAGGGHCQADAASSVVYGSSAFSSQLASAMALLEWPKGRFPGAGGGASEGRGKGKERKQEAGLPQKEVHTDSKMMCLIFEGQFGGTKLGKH